MCTDLLICDSDPVRDQLLGSHLAVDPNSEPLIGILLTLTIIIIIVTVCRTGTSKGGGVDIVGGLRNLNPPQTLVGRWQQTS